MTHSLTIVIASLTGAPVIMLAARLLRADSLSWGVRSLLWVVAGAVVFAVARETGGLEAARLVMGVAEPALRSLTSGAVGAAAIMIAVGAVWALLRSGGVAVGDQAGFDRIVKVPAPRRLFLVTTAAVVEEVLYRGVAIGFGATVIGSPILAAAVSTTAFVIAHLGWKPSHLAPVAVGGGGMAVLYLVTGDLWACIIAHFIIDSMGFFFAPTIRSLRRQNA